MSDFYEELGINPRGQFYDGASNTIFFSKLYPKEETLYWIIW